MLDFRKCDTEPIRCLKLAQSARDAVAQSMWVERPPLCIYKVSRLDSQIELRNLAEEPERTPNSTYVMRLSVPGG